MATSAAKGGPVINPSLNGDALSQEVTGPQLPPSQTDLEVSELARPQIKRAQPEETDLKLNLRDFFHFASTREGGSNRDSGIGDSRTNSLETASPDISSPALLEEEQEADVLDLRLSSLQRHSSSHAHNTAHVVHEVFERFIELQGATKASEEFAAEILEAASHTAQGLGDARMGTEIFFPGLEGIISLPTLVTNGKMAVIALREGRMVDFSDHSSGALKASLAISGAGVELASAAKEIMKEGWIEAAKEASKSAGHVASTLALAASGVNMAGWAVYGGMQVFALSQLSKPMNNLQRILKSSMPEELKMHEAFKEMEKEFVVTNEEIETIRAEHTNEEEAQKQIKIVLEKKFNKLKRCVGDKKAKLISSQMLVISRTLGHAREQENEAHLIPVNQMISDLIKSMKNEMAKQKVLRYEKLAVSVAGLVGAGVGIACPIAGAVIAVAVSAAAIYVWYQGKKDNAEKYADMSVFGRKLFNFEPDESLADEGVPSTGLTAENEDDHHLPPEAMLINPAAITGFDINDVDVSLPEDGILINAAAVRGFDIDEIDDSLPEDGILINAAALGIGPNTSDHAGEVPSSNWTA